MRRSVDAEPLGARTLLGISSADLAGRTVHLCDLLGERGKELLERLHEASSWQHRSEVLDDVLERGLIEESDYGFKLQRAWNGIFDSDGKTQIAELARNMGWSRRHLAQVFASDIGLTPKSLARIARFEHACRIIRRGGTGLADIAAESGYADQPHLGRDWVAITGMAPQQWIQREFPFVQDYELGGGLLATQQTKGESDVGGGRWNRNQARAGI
jgi:AraC-like DNA-binding protein